MSIERTVLLTARSACAAWGILEIWRYLSEGEGFSITILSQEPATTILKSHHVPVVEAKLQLGLDASDENSKKILSYTESFLADVKPDVVLVGLSTPGTGGIDEAVLATAKCPTFMLQDFWGDSNLFFGKHPDYYLVMDDEAKLITDHKYNTSSVVVGSPRHVKYSKLNFDMLQKEMYKSLGLSADSIVHGFFCQPLFCPGYLETIEAWADTVKTLRYDRVVYRPHPGSPLQLVESIENILKERDLDYALVKGGDVECVIAVCSTISSAMSNTNLDVAYVNYFSSKAMAVPIYLAFNKELICFLERFQKIDKIPTVKLGVALLVKNYIDLSSTLSAATKPKIRNLVWLKARSLPNPMRSIDNIKALLLKVKCYF